MKARKPRELADGIIEAETEREIQDILLKIRLAHPLDRKGILRELVKKAKTAEDVDILRKVVKRGHLLLELQEVQRELESERLRKKYGRKLMNPIYRTVATFPSKTTPGKVYTVKVDERGGLSCNCPRWIFARDGMRTCPHIQALKNPKPTKVFAGREYKLYGTTVSTTTARRQKAWLEMRGYHVIDEIEKGVHKLWVISPGKWVTNPMSLYQSFHGNPPQNPKKDYRKDRLIEQIIPFATRRHKLRPLPSWRHYLLSRDDLQKFSIPQLRWELSELNMEIFQLEPNMRNPNLYKSFHGNPPQNVRAVNLPVPKKGEHLIAIGKAVSIVYTPYSSSKLSGKHFEHKFGDTGERMLPERPILATDKRGKALYLIPESRRYPRMTRRGIVG